MSQTATKVWLYTSNPFITVDRFLKNVMCIQTVKQGIGTKNS